MIITIQVKTNKRNNNIFLLGDDLLELHLKSAPIDGKANKELIKYLAKTLKIANSFIKIEKGLTSHIKRVNIDIDINKWNEFKSHLKKQLKLC